MQKQAKPRRKDVSELDSVLQLTRRAIRYAFIFGFCQNTLMMLLPVYSLQVLDRVISSHSVDTLMVLSIIMTVCFIFYGIFNAIRTYVFQGISDWLDAKLAPRLLKLSITKSSFGHPATAGQYQRDLMSIKAFINGGLGVIMDVPWSLMFLLVIYMISPIMGFFSLLGVIVLLLFALLNEYATKGMLEKAQQNNIQSMQIADIASRNAEAVEAMGMMDSVVRNWVTHNDIGLSYQNKAASRANIIQSISRTLRMLMQIGVTGLGAYLALKNEMTSGGMIACSILVGRAMAPFEGAIGIWKVVVTAREAYHRLKETMDASPELRGSMPLPRPTGHLVAENVFFQPPGANAILKNINFELKPGESLGIIGPSAAGKSTLAKIIVGILPTTHGSMRLDGAETFKWNRQDLGRYIGYMPQHVDLFNGTIKDNIARMDMQASPEDVIYAAKVAGCHEMILRLPKGYETEFVQGNLSLSPGQRQRIGLARAIYGNPQFIIMDEPNGNLDGEGERALLNALGRMKQMGITFIVVAHRPSIVGNVDKILTLRGGAVEAFGMRDAVLKQYTGSAAAGGVG